MKTAFLLLAFALSVPLCAEERFLLAADAQVIEVNREGRVTDLLRHFGHSGIYDAWRLPDGGFAYVHRGGLAVFDATKKLVSESAATRGEKGFEANSCAVLDGGSRVAYMDSGANSIRVVDRSGAVVGETPVPDLSTDPLHFRYRTVREIPGTNAFWVCQYARKTLLKVENGTGNVLQSIPIEPLLTPTAAIKKAFSIVQCNDGTLWVATSTGCQLLRINQNGDKLSCRTSEELGVSCRYLLGMQCLENGSVLVACGDYHLKTPDESSDLLIEIGADGKIVWRLKRAQLVDQVEGIVDKKTGLEEMRITNVHAYDSDHLRDCLKVRR
jgi:hypothetical protein